MSAVAEAQAGEERASIQRLMDQALGLRDITLDQREQALVERETSLGRRERHNDELRDANEKLVIATLTADELREAAQAAGRRQDEFLAMLAHELRNPLAPISSAAEVLGRLGAAPVPASLIGMIRRSVRHMVRLLDDLLDASRLTVGKVVLQRRRIAVAEFIQDAVESSRELIAAKGHRLSVDLPSRALFIDGDSARLVQIFVNLLNNAAKYTPNGGSISIGAREEDDRIVLRVSDNGMGMSTEALPHVFDLFVQDKRALSRSEGGLGIGLTVVRRMVELHGGTVEARSPGRDQGSEFVVSFAAVRDVEAAPEAAPVAAAPAPAPTRILVVEDNVDAAEALAELLRMSGHDVTVAFDGFAGIAQFDEASPRVVLCDIGLPGMNGYELAQRMRASARQPRPALIAITGYGDRQASERALAAGFDHHVVKPVDFEVLLRLIDTALLAERGLP